jgi:hypothetical protein
VTYLRRKQRFSSMDRVEPPPADMTIQSACAIVVADVQDLIWDYGNHEKYGRKMAASRACIDVQGFLSSYFRVGPVFNKLTGAFYKGVMLARIEIDDKHRGQGLCRCMLDGLEELCDDMHLALMVEHVMEPMTSPLARSLRRRGYEEHSDSLCPSFYRWNPRAPAFTLTQT